MYIGMASVYADIATKCDVQYKIYKYHGIVMTDEYTVI